MGALSDLAARLERGASTAYRRGLDAAAEAVRAAILDGLGPHRRTGNAASTLRVTVSPVGIEIDGARYLPTIADVPRRAELERIVGEAFARAAREGFAP